MKNFRIKHILIFALVLAYFSCRDESTLPYPDINEYAGAVTNLETNPDKSFFNALNDLATEEVEFSIDVNGFKLTTVNSVDLELEFTQLGVLLDLEGKPRDSIWAPVLISNVTSFPSTVTVNGQQVADALGLSVDDFAVGDGFQLTFPIHTDDGRVLTVALNSDLCNEPVQPSFGGCSYRWSISCPSDISGSVNYEILDSQWFDGSNVNGQSGTMSWDEVGSGLYDWDTFTFGGYQTLYACCEQERGNTVLYIQDVCNTLSLRSADGFGCPWLIESIDENSGPVLTLSIYGDCLGTYQIKFTRTDGSDWPVFSL